MNIEERIERIEAHLFGKAEQPQQKLRDFVVPLAHATLTREEVAVRCIAAAEKKGYRANEDSRWSTLVGSDSLGIEADHFFANPSSDGYAFHNHECAARPLTTLEAFEEYCGVVQTITANDFRVPASQMHGKELIIFVRESVMQESEQPQQYVGLADETAEPQVHGIVNTLDAPAQPVYQAGFSFSWERQFLCLPDGTELYFGLEGCWQKDESVDEKDPHTLTPVATYTVGKFYAIDRIALPNLNNYQNYALCVGGCGVGKFVKARMDNGVVVVQTVDAEFVSNLEVTPL